MPEPRIRQAVRALVLDDQDRVLLARFESPVGMLWIMPGGGVEPGESDEHALHRELAEEVGLVGARIGPCIWQRRRLLPFADGSFDGQTDRVHLVRTATFEPAPQFTAEQLAEEGVHELRWWTVEEIAASPELFAPRSLAALATALLRDGPPEATIELED
jgi:8-oxo-dGTP pyrophosphatase MutT (NUDIX family)